MIIDKTRKVLVLKWSAKEEEFIYSMKNLVGLAEKLTLAKRDTYKISTIFHDPLGMITPIALQSKLFFHKIFNFQIFNKKLFGQTRKYHIEVFVAFSILHFFKNPKMNQIIIKPAFLNER